MKNNLLKAFSLVVLSVPALALAAPPISVATVAQIEKVEVDATGQRNVRLVPADTVVPGTEVVYTITIANQGAEAARDIVIDNPVPSHSEFVPGSAHAPGGAVTFSVDGGRTYGVAEQLRVRESSGVERPAHAGEYTHLRFAFQPTVAPGQSVMARFRAVVK